MVSRVDDGAAWGAWRPRLPRGVRWTGDALVDDVACEAVRLDGDAAELMHALDGMRTARELEARWPGALSLLIALNDVHLVNFEPSGDDRGTRPAVCERFPLGACSLPEILAGVLRACWGHVRATPYVTAGWTACCLAAIALAFATTPIVLLVPLLTGAGFVAHEVGHGLAARGLCGRAYVVASARGVCVAAPVERPRDVRIFAAAGPLLPVLIGCAVVLACDAFAWPAWMAAPFLFHFVFLFPPLDDGLVLLHGRAPEPPADEGVSRAET